MNIPFNNEVKLLLPMIFSWSSAFIKLEPTGTSTLSLGARVTFTCSRNTTQNSIGWIAVLASGESLYAEGNYEHFNELGLTIIMLNQTMSEIEFVPMNVNLSSLRCQYIQSSNAMPVMSNVAVLSIIELPQKPMNVSVTIKNNALRVNWTTATTTTRTNAEHTITLTNTMTLVSSVATVRNGTLSHTFDVSQRETCYQFMVKIAAVNTIGVSENITISGRYPVLPNSLSHRLTDVNGVITLTATFNVPVCIWSSDTFYILKVTKLDSNTDYSGACTFDSATGRVCRTIGLPGNSHYKFHVQCSNRWGSVSSSTTRIVSTPHLSGVSLKVINSTRLRIRCEYLVGVVITGCIYALVPVDKSRGNITGMILRTNGDEVEVEIDRIGCYEELVVTVVENGATNLLSLPRRMQLRQNFTFDCPLAAQVATTDAGTSAPRAAVSVALVVAVPLAGAALIGIIAGAIVALGIALYLKREKRENLEKKTSSSYNQRTSVDKLKIPSTENSRSNMISLSTNRSSMSPRSR